MLFIGTNIALAVIEVIFYWTRTSAPLLLSWLTLLITACLLLFLIRSFSYRTKAPSWSSSPFFVNTPIFLLATIWGGQAFLLPLTDPGILSIHNPALILLGIVFITELSSRPFASTVSLFLLFAPSLSLYYSGADLLLQPALAITLLLAFLLTLLFLPRLSSSASLALQAEQKKGADPVLLNRKSPSSSNQCLCPDDVIWKSILEITNPDALHSSWQTCFANIRSGICRALEADDFFLLEKNASAGNSLFPQGKEKTNSTRYSWILSVPIWMDLLRKEKILHKQAENHDKKEQNLLQREGIKTLLLIPLMVKSELWGIIGLNRRDTATIFSQQQINSLRFIANIMAITISNQHDRSERDRLVTVVEQSSDCIIIINNSGHILYANPACEQVTGFSPDEIIGKSIKRLYAPSVRKTVWNQVKGALLKGEGWNGQFANYRKDNTLYEEEMHISPVYNHEGGVANQVIIKRNITEEKRLESIAEAANLMDNIGFIFSSIRHELGNPINSIKVSLSVLESNLETYETADIKRFISRSLSDIGRVEYLLKTLKNFSVFERPYMEPTDMRALLDKLLQLTEKDLSRQDVTLRIEHPPKPLIGLIDPRAFLQVLLNLITNAVVALEGIDDKQITISMSGEQNGQITFNLEDNGCGMEEATIKNLFRPFFTTKPEGTGLGLVIVKKMLSKMNCSIDARSWKDKGTQMQIIIPEA